MITIEQLALAIASDFNLLLKYFRRYWETTKIFLSNIYSNKIISDENFPYYGTYLLKPLRWIFQFQVGCHIWLNTIEYTVDYSKQNGTDFGFIGWRVVKL